MTEFERIAVLDNEAEAGALDAILDERGIPHMIWSFHDAALDGLFQIQRGWGSVEASQSHKTEITQILDDLREQAQSDAGSPDTGSPDF